MATTLGGVEIPGAYVQDTDREILGGGIVRAVDGTPHRNSVKRIRRWSIETRAMTYEQFKALETVYNAANGGTVALHLDEWESGFVNVFILEFPDSRSRIPDGGTNSMRTIRIVVEEA